MGILTDPIQTAPPTTGGFRLVDMRPATSVRLGGIAVACQKVGSGDNLAAGRLVLR